MKSNKRKLEQIFSSLFFARFSQFNQCYAKWNKPILFSSRDFILFVPFFVSLSLSCTRVTPFNPGYGFCATVAWQKPKRKIVNEREVFSKLDQCVIAVTCDVAKYFQLKHFSSWKDMRILCRWECVSVYD